jgi:hypothetical protein
MRTWDEAAKDPTKLTHPIEYYLNLIERNLPHPSAGYTISPSQMDFFQKNGYLKLSKFLQHEKLNIDEVSNWVDEIATLADQNKSMNIV